jgi:hypothetical protein
MPVLDIALLDGSELNKHHHKLVAVYFQWDAGLLGNSLNGNHELLVKLFEDDFLGLRAQFLFAKKVICWLSLDQFAVRV